jgi:hypothetical protein
VVSSSPKVNRGIQARASIPLAAQGEQVTATYLLTTLPTLASSYPTLVPVSLTRENVLGQNCCDEIYETRPTEIWFDTSPPMDNSLLILFGLLGQRLVQRKGPIRFRQEYQ